MYDYDINMTFFVHDTTATLSGYVSSSDYNLDESKTKLPLNSNYHGNIHQEVCMLASLATPS